MEVQNQNVQGATDEQITETAQVDLGGQQDVAGTGSEAQAEAGASDQSEQGQAATGAEEGRQVVIVTDAILLDVMRAKMAGLKVKMLTPEDGTQNPITVSDTTYAGTPGEEVTVQAQHTYALIDAGWKIIHEGWEEAHTELRAHRDLLASIPEPLRYMTKVQLEELGVALEKAFE